MFLQLEVCVLIGYDFDTLLVCIDIATYLYSRVSDKSSSLLKSCVSDAGSTLETYELKLSINSTHRLAVHLEFKDGGPVVTQLKADDCRLLMVDVMCLNQYVYRIDIGTSAQRL